ncbi:MAG: 50S ribosomal protein L10 [Gemmatimonadetes bacterium]|nr:50S ribosomal protein L10 [Gemmatimonadota bacterium]MBT8478028.1 50S ribosomal protein L10 [Gemmatimonadota bacterium]NNK47840.1 50S ribosomal protein L10 [Gemmatimonadota bacterium]
MAMKLDQKQTITAELQGMLSSSDVVYLTDFTGLTVDAIGVLRRQLREAGAEYRVVKNTLTIRALEGTDIPDLTEHLQGPTALVLGGSDPVAPAKVVRDFAKGNDERPVVKVGVVERRVVSQEEVSRLAELPPMEHLLASIAGGLTAGVGGIAGALNAVIRDIAYMVEEVAKQGEQ